MKNPIPFEYQGRARLLRQRVLAADDLYTEAAKQIMVPMEYRLAKKPTLREGMIIDLTRSWQAIEHPFRLAMTVDIPRKGRILITDVVLGGTTDREPEWHVDEKSIGILKVSLNSFDRPYLRVTPLATVSMHSLARFIQRSPRTDDMALIEEMKRIAAQDDERVETSRGAWMSYPRDASTPDGRRFRVRVFRTFYDNDMMYAQPSIRAA